MQQPKHTNEIDAPMNPKNVIVIMRAIIETLEDNPLNVRSCLPAISDVSRWSNIENLDTLLSDLQRSLREQALYKSSGYDENVRAHANKITQLFSAVLADSSGQVH